MMPLLVRHSVYSLCSFPPIAFYVSIKGNCPGNLRCLFVTIRLVGHLLGVFADIPLALDGQQQESESLSCCCIPTGRVFRWSWSSWSLNCSTVYVGYPESIPDDTAIPQWAYEDVTASGGYHATLVQAARGELVWYHALGALQRFRDDFAVREKLKNCRHPLVS
ncbi:hypothetical protein EDD16DRAFT_1724835 [Pisolithus croceorrhizus]|nr:hypothetical protein EDD16DRAFT_1724835 [Pisolithus croceorrhizus]